MAANTAAKRYSAININAPWRGLNVVPSASITAGQRAAVMYLYDFDVSGSAESSESAGILIGVGINMPQGFAVGGLLG